MPNRHSEPRVRVRARNSSGCKQAMGSVPDSRRDQPTRIGKPQRNQNLAKPHRSTRAGMPMEHWEPTIPTPADSKLPTDRVGAATVLNLRICKYRNLELRIRVPGHSDPLELEDFHETRMPSNEKQHPHSLAVCLRIRCGQHRFKPRNQLCPIRLPPQTSTAHSLAVTTHSANPRQVTKVFAEAMRDIDVRSPRRSVNDGLYPSLSGPTRPRRVEVIARLDDRAQVAARERGPQR